MRPSQALKLPTISIRLPHPTHLPFPSSFSYLSLSLTSPHSPISSHITLQLHFERKKAKKEGKERRKEIKERQHTKPIPFSQAKRPKTHHSYTIITHLKKKLGAFKSHPLEPPKPRPCQGELGGGGGKEELAPKPTILGPP